MNALAAALPRLLPALRAKVGELSGALDDLGRPAAKALRIAGLR